MSVYCRLRSLVAACFLATICSTADAHPVIVRDAFNRTVKLSAPPQRIVTVFSSNTELVAALGLADRIVGLDAFTRYRMSARRRSGR
jgi:iron complex transport system substrate-binding protein